MRTKVRKPYDVFLEDLLERKIIFTKNKDILKYLGLLDRRIQDNFFVGYNRRKSIAVVVLVRSFKKIREARKNKKYSSFEFY